MSSSSSAHAHHTHAHDHAHAHGDPGRDIASENRAHFDKTAASYDAIPGALDLAAKVGKGIREHYRGAEGQGSGLDPQKTRVLEFASGTGACLFFSVFCCSLVFYLMCIC